MRSECLDLDHVLVYGRRYLQRVLRPTSSTTAGNDRTEVSSWPIRFPGRGPSRGRREQGHVAHSKPQRRAAHDLDPRGPLPARGSSSGILGPSTAVSGAPRWMPSSLPERRSLCVPRPYSGGSRGDRRGEQPYAALGLRRGFPGVSSLVIPECQPTGSGPPSHRRRIHSRSCRSLEQMRPERRRRRRGR